MIRSVLAAATVALLTIGRAPVASASHEDHVFVGRIQDIDIDEVEDADVIDSLVVRVWKHGEAIDYTVAVDEETHVDSHGADLDHDELVGEWVLVTGDLDDDLERTVIADTADIFDDDDQDVLVGWIQSADIDRVDDNDVVDSLVLRVWATADDFTDYTVDLDGDTDLHLGGVARPDLAGKRAIVVGDLDDDAQLDAELVMVVKSTEDGDSDSDGDSDDDGNGGNGGGMSEAAKYKNERVDPGPGRGAFMRCVHEGGSFEECERVADEVNSNRGHGRGNKHKNKH